MIHLVNKHSEFTGFKPEKYLKGDLDSIPTNVRDNLFEELQSLYIEHRIMQDDSAAEMRGPLASYLEQRVENYQNQLEEYGIELVLPK